MCVGLATDGNAPSRRPAHLQLLSDSAPREPELQREGKQLRLRLRDGRVFDIHHCSFRDGRWHRERRETATHCAFVPATGEPLFYRLQREDRDRVDADRLASQLERAIYIESLAARLRGARISWHDTQLVFTDPAGRRWRVHDGWYQSGELRLFPVGRSHAPQRFFIPLDHESPNRMIYLGVFSRTVSPWELAEQLRNSQIVDAPAGDAKSAKGKG